MEEYRLQRCSFHGFYACRNSTCEKQSSKDILKVVVIVGSSFTKTPDSDISPNHSQVKLVVVEFQQWGEFREFWRSVPNPAVCGSLRMGKIVFPFLAFSERDLSPSTEHFGVMPSEGGTAVCLVAYYLCTVLWSKRH